MKEFMTQTSQNHSGKEEWNMGSIALPKVDLVWSLSSVLESPALLTSPYARILNETPKNSDDDGSVARNSKSKDHIVFPRYLHG
jgi:hypothetical protein